MRPALMFVLSIVFIRHLAKWGSMTTNNSLLILMNVLTVVPASLPVR